MLERYEEFSCLINKINKDIQKIKLQELKKYGLKGSQMDFIYYLGKHKELSFKNLCKVLKCDKAFVSRNLPLLKDKNLIIEKTNSSNKIIYSLSDKGFDIYKSNNQTAEKICEELYIANDEVNEFYKNLKQISKKLQEIGDNK